MNSKHGLNGSTWRRWDLHIHAPGTKLSNGYGEPNDENLKSFVNELENSKVQAFGITDYFSFDGYHTVVSAYKKHFPSGEKLFIPNIEFRLTETQQFPASKSYEQYQSLINEMALSFS
ncbi:hypothetical protein ACUNV4_29645 [Granulosicoccus sp. 3-233]|uniref:hypothetical protein n=1 Tax=Granulosicoccus sp. 3-233 TaxID=3417969 RepID=UPI003D355591